MLNLKIYGNGSGDLRSLQNLNPGVIDTVPMTGRIHFSGINFSEVGDFDVSDLSITNGTIDPEFCYGK